MEVNLEKQTIINGRIWDLKRKSKLLKNVKVITSHLVIKKLPRLLVGSDTNHGNILYIYSEWQEIKNDQT